MMRAGLFLLGLLFLFSCSPISKKDGKENSPPEDFSQVGTASWYGDGFHGKETASSELFDMYACTAAHMSLPLGTLVRVSNLENGREVFVKINDRGPYAGGRIIDLSHAAAGSVGITEENGIAKVRIRVISSFLSNYFRTKPILLTLLAAVLGTGGMGLFILSVKRLGFISPDIVRAVGGMYTESSQNALLPGVIIHFVVGVVVAFLYIAFLGPFFLLLHIFFCRHGRRDGADCRFCCKLFSDCLSEEAQSTRRISRKLVLK
jgi:rare lipoprotein A